MNGVESLGDHEDLMILRALSWWQPATKRALESATGLGPGAIRSRLGRLVTAGLVQQAGQFKESGGRPSAAFELNPSAGFALGLDLGRTATRFMVTDLQGSPVFTALSDPLLRPNEIWTPGEVSAFVSNQLEERGLPRDRLWGLGIGVRGLATDADTVWPFWPLPAPLSKVQLAKEVHARCGIPTLVRDHVQGRAYAERLYGIARGQEDFVYIWLGSGVVAAIVINGCLYQGKGVIVGEVGHVMVDPDGPRCTCGRRGCLEAVASSSAIKRRVRDSLSQGVVSTLSTQGGGDNDISITRVVQEAAQGDQMSFFVLNRIGEDVGRAIATMLNILGMDLVVLGGEAAASSVLLEASNRMLQLTVHSALFPRVRVVTSSLDEWSSARGAAALVIDGILGGQWSREPVGRMREDIGPTRSDGRRVSVYEASPR